MSLSSRYHTGSYPDELGNLDPCIHIALSSLLCVPLTPHTEVFPWLTSPVPDGQRSPRRDGSPARACAHRDSPPSGMLRARTWPSTYPASWRPGWNAVTQGVASPGDLLPRNPLT